MHDVASDRFYLFCDSGWKSAKPAVFELATGARLRTYDPALFKPGDQGPGELRQVVGYARVLQALRLINEPPSPAKAPR